MRFLLYYLSPPSYRYVELAEARRDVLDKRALLDRTVLEEDFSVRTITRREERDLFSEGESHVGP